MSKKRMSRKNEPGLKHLDETTVNAAAAGDMTGLIPANPQKTGETESYKQIRGMGN